MITLAILNVITRNRSAWSGISTLAKLFVAGLAEMRELDGLLGVDQLLPRAQLQLLTSFTDAQKSVEKRRLLID